MRCYLEQLVGDVICLTAEMIACALAVRGAIVLSELYQTPGIVVGDALIDAHDLEKKGAVYPRVILSPQVVRACLGIAEKTTDAQVMEWINAGVQDARAEGHEHAGLPINVVRDFDGYYFVDHLCTNLDIAESETDDLLEHRKYLMSIHLLIAQHVGQFAEANGQGSSEIADRLLKWIWYANYFNRAGATFNARSPANPVPLFSLTELFPDRETLGSEHV